MDDLRKPKRSLVGVELVRLLASEGDRIFTTDRARELGSRVGLKDSYLWESLYHLRQNGWIVSLRRGLYALSSTVPGITPVHEFEVAMALVDPAAISHWSALHYHGMTDQVPTDVFVLTMTGTSVPRLRNAKGRQERDGYPVGDIFYRFVQMKPVWFFGIEKVWIGESRVSITDPERTLLDGIAMPHYCGDFAEVLHAFEVRGDRLDLPRIISYALNLSIATVKRLGWILEHAGVAAVHLEPLARVPIRGYRSLDPNGPRKGYCNRHWMIQENLPGKVMR